jgi:hypothetical protein
MKLPLKDLLKRLMPPKLKPKLTKYLENQCPLALIPLKVIKKIQLIIPFEVFK